MKETSTREWTETSTKDPDHITDNTNKTWEECIQVCSKWTTWEEECQMFNKEEECHKLQCNHLFQCNQCHNKTKECHKCLQHPNKTQVKWLQMPDIFRSLKNSFLLSLTETLTWRSKLDKLFSNSSICLFLKKERQRSLVCLLSFQLIRSRHSWDHLKHFRTRFQRLLSSSIKLRSKELTLKWHERTRVFLNTTYRELKAYETGLFLNI